VGNGIIGELRGRFGNRGLQIALCDIEKVRTLSSEIERRHSAGEIPSSIYSRYLAHFSFIPPDALPTARSVLLVASPIGRSSIELDLECGPFVASIPPTYGGQELIAEAEALLADILSPRKIGFVGAWLPWKSLAARAGLARYGRDNVLHFKGAGSFVRLDAWWIELAAEGEYWGEPETLARCASCGACIKACPNGCFSEGKFIVDASKCLTFLNEGPGDFPDWLGPECHNAAVGCLRCQDACPDNRNVPGKAIYRRFTLDREASALVLAGRPIAELPELAAQAVRAAEMVGCEERLARNLRALIAAKASDPKARA
jgi:epoxyqueuosine reductase